MLPRINFNLLITARLLQNCKTKKQFLISQNKHIQLKYSFAVLLIYAVIRHRYTSLILIKGKN